LKQHTKLPVVVGFGVKNAEGAAAIAEAADGAVVGSSLVEAIRLSLNGGAATLSTVGAVSGLVETLARGVRAVPK
jgi:tryptophan synthase alpha chain